jgi:hypothetical protein
VNDVVIVVSLIGLTRVGKTYMLFAALCRTDTDICLPCDVMRHAYVERNVYAGGVIPRLGVLA